MNKMSKKVKWILAILCIVVVVFAVGYKGFTMYRNIHAKLNDILFVVDKNTKAINDIAATLTDQNTALAELTTIAQANADILDTLTK